MGSPRFEFDGVDVRFGETRALDGVSLRIEAGERVAVVGPSGAGKTTLLQLLIGARRPTAGRVRVDGRELTGFGRAELRKLRADIGSVYQDHRLVPTQRVLTNVLCGQLGRWSFPRALRELAWPRRREKERVHAILERVGIPEKLFERIESLSGGQQQRVAIARALYQSPSVLLADEPLGGIDPARARDTIGLLHAVTADAGLTLCATLHDLELAREFFPRLIGLRRGRVLFDAASRTLRDEDFAALYRMEEEGEDA